MIRVEFAIQDYGNVDDIQNEADNEGRYLLDYVARAISADALVWWEVYEDGNESA